jgi:hypothetical protein
MISSIVSSSCNDFAHMMQYCCQPLVQSDDNEGEDSSDNDGPPLVRSDDNESEDSSDNESNDNESEDSSDNDEPEMFGLEPNSRCILEFDCDSAYFGNHNFRDLIDACGTNCSFGFDSLIERIKSSNGFRFGVDTTSLVNSPIYYKSFKAKKINLEALPNVKIATCRLNALKGHAMSIYVSYIGSKFVRKSNMFKNEELAVITVGMNLVKTLLVADMSLSQRTRYSIDAIPAFESKSTERKFDRVKVNTNYTISHERMKLFATEFETALDLLGTEEGDRMWKSEYIGMAWEQPLDEKLDFELIKEFLEDFKHNHYFTANAAGFKELMKENEIFIKIRRGEGPKLDDIYPYVEEKMELIYANLRNDLFAGANFGSQYYFFDIATTLIPNQKNDYAYLLNTERMKPNLVRFLNKR